VAEVFTASLQEDIHNFQATQATLSAAQCERAVDLILSSDRVFTLGFGGSGYLASLLQRGLSTSCDYVESLASAGGASHAARRLSRVSSRDLVIAITFPRYVRDTVLLARAAKKMGSSLIVLTDRPTSPLAPDATVVLYVSSERQYSAISETAVLGFIEALCAATAYKAKNSLESAAKLAESVMPWLIFGEDSHG
jgi:DNA-binding MurR/RpiR family transcriptional regulator